MDPASSSSTEPAAAGTSRNAARAQLSFAERKANMTKASSPHLVEGSQITRSIDRAPPGDPAASARARRARSKPELGRQRSLYFENAFSTRDGGGGDTAAQDRVRREAKVVAEVRTNVIVCLSPSLPPSSAHTHKHTHIYIHTYTQEPLIHGRKS